MEEGRKTWDPRGARRQLAASAHEGAHEPLGKLSWQATLEIAEELRREWRGERTDQGTRQASLIVLEEKQALREPMPQKVEACLLHSPPRERQSGERREEE